MGSIIDGDGHDGGGFEFVVQQISALLVVTVFALSCAECDGGVGAAHAKLGIPANQASAARTVQRKEGLVGHGVALRKTSARGISKSSARRQLAVKQAQRVRLVKRQQAARRKNPDRMASNVKSSKRQIAMHGLASFYSEDRETASGERFDRHGLNAAHPSLPFGTRLRVTNVRNGRSVTVQVNDRGPFAHGRIIDVTSAAAEALGMIDAGVVEVTLDVVDEGTGRL
jgi:rare lipoprotein A